jgi:DNA-binding NarL/FixJ family response regulator
MTTPLALIFYENLLIGNQLINRLRDLGYRAKPVRDLTKLPQLAAEEKPLVVVTELAGLADRVCAAVRAVRAQAATAHVPVLAIQSPTKKRADKKVAEAARAAGVTLVASKSAYLAQLPQLLEQVLELH